MDCFSVPAWINAGSVLVLVGVTAWYAWSTSRMLESMRKQVDTMRDQVAAMRDQLDAVRSQSKVIAISAQIASVAPRVGLMMEEGRAKKRLQELHDELESLKTHGAGNE